MSQAPWLSGEVIGSPRPLGRKKRTRKTRIPSAALTTDYQSIDRFIEKVGEGFACKVCKSKTYKSKGAAQAHYKRDHEPRLLPAECQYCRKASTSQVAITRHEASEHEQDQEFPFPCKFKNTASKCARKFKTYDEWRAHFETDHDFLMPPLKWTTFEQVIDFNIRGVYVSDKTSHGRKQITEDREIMKTHRTFDEICQMAEKLRKKQLEKHSL